MKADKKLAREAEEREREEKAKKKEKEEEEEKERRKMEEEEEQRKEEEERKRKEEEQRREHDEYRKMKEAFSVEEEGFDDEDGEEGEGGEENKLRKFVDYIKETKVVLLEDLAAHFKMKAQDTVDRVTQLQEDGLLTGVIDDRGKFIYISQEELEAVAKFIRQRGRVRVLD